MICRNIPGSDEATEPATSVDINSDSLHGGLFQISPRCHLFHCLDVAAVCPVVDLSSVGGGACSLPSYSHPVRLSMAGDDPTNPRR